jgi:hypothetical protein
LYTSNDDVALLFQLRETHDDAYDEPESDEGHPSSFSNYLSHQMGIQGPSFSYVPIHGVLSVILLYMGPIEAMRYLIQSYMWARGYHAISLL